MLLKLFSPLRVPVSSRCLLKMGGRQRAVTRPLRPQDKESLPVASYPPFALLRRKRRHRRNPDSSGRCAGMLVLPLGREQQKLRT